jgi:periplasmic protein TonB
MSDPDIDRKPSRLIWIIAALAALAFHAGCVALAMTHVDLPDVDESLGAPAIEIGLDMTAPHRDPTDLPPGPDTEASEQKQVVKSSELPEAMPTETENPDRVVSPDKSQTVQQDEPDQPAPKPSTSTEQAAVEAMATPSYETVPEAPRSVAPAEGLGKAAQRVRATWQKELVSHLNKHMRYPIDRFNKTVVVVVNFVLDRTGHVVSISIAKGSGDAVFDQAALATIRRSDPVPKPPPLVADEGLSFDVPLTFTGRS